MRYVFYTMIWYMLLPILWVLLWLRGRSAPDYRKRWNERLAYGAQKDTLSSCVWIHAVSVGETLAAAPMIEELLEKYPQTNFLLTTTTPTGSDRVKALFGDRVHHVYCPWDLPSAWRRFFNAYHPQLILIVETELWPNLMAKASKEAVPVWLVNGRLSEKSFNGYHRLRYITTPALQSYQGLLVQTQAEAERYRNLGVEPEKVHVTGSVKFDLQLSQEVQQKAAALRCDFGDRPVWVAASTHEGEEEEVIVAHQQVLKQFSDALLVLVPRHPERFKGVAELLHRENLQCARRSEGKIPNGSEQVYLGDTMGELLMLYGAADLAFVGGSFAAIGGHNLLEPAAWEHPVLSGPTLFNFTRIAELLLESGALTIVENGQQLGAEVTRLFANQQEREEEGRAAAKVVAAHGGALAKTVNQLSDVWPLS